MFDMFKKRENESQEVNEWLMREESYGLFDTKEEKNIEL